MRIGHLTLSVAVCTAKAIATTIGAIEIIVRMKIVFVIHFCSSNICQLLFIQKFNGFAIDKHFQQQQKI